MIKTIPMYQVVCDRCGFVDNEGDYFAWAEPDQAVMVASDSEWLITDDGKHYCLECWTWDEEEDNQVPKMSQPVDV